MKKCIILGMGILGILSLTAFTSQTTIKIPQRVSTEFNEIIATINKNTTEQELEDLKMFFSENGIELIVERIEFNSQNEITSLNIILKKGNAKSKYASSSSEPISDVELGYKNGNLYITNSGMFDISSWRNQIGFNKQNFDLDSILKNHNFRFNFDFDKESDSIFFNGKHFDIGSLKNQIMNSFEFKEDENGNLIFNSQQFPSHFSKSKKFSFVDDPDIEKLIIIDGKEADFKTLDKLAKADQLEEVDFLKATTAISLYGDKAKDGAIIATSKK
ncbi:hypothetical protein SAMN04487910_3673 [Aquimarina amphilecti]|uniref:Uncharacterized protein n=1 Tax=Aquimarina amphilecti TaxID=1038014 RepID=A0A1H7UCV3_AQUAM|nr:hypothetical protein [Aquimarina amphilecti]SEL94594.1 hypothetical protein SAMN04487910_3673 [Aquimarina amphilecti]